MKATAICAMLFSILIVDIHSQDYPKLEGKVNYSEVITLDSTIAAEDLYKVLKEWVLSDRKTFNRGNSEKLGGQVKDMVFGIERPTTASVDKLYENGNPLKLDSPEKLIARVVYKYTGSSTGCVRCIYFDYNLKISIKPGKYKYEITDISYANYNLTDMREMDIWGGRDNCKARGNLEELIKCDRCTNGLEKLHSDLKSDLGIVINKLKEIAETAKKSQDSENW